MGRYWAYGILDVECSAAAMFLLFIVFHSGARYLEGLRKHLGHGQVVCHIPFAGNRYKQNSGSIQSVILKPDAHLAKCPLETLFPYP